MIGKGAFQETDVFGVTAQIVKHNYLVMDMNDIPRIVKEAFYIAQTGRPGPVLIDIPKNIQLATTQPIFPSEVNLRGYNPVKHADDVALNEVIGLIEAAKSPMIYCGGGIISGEASAELLEFVERTRHPGGDDAHGHRLLPGDARAFAEVARHARHRLREQRGERSRPAARHRRAFRRPRDGQDQRVRQARHDRPHRHRQLRDQQEQGRAPADPERREIRARPAERTARASRASKRVKTEFHTLSRSGMRRSTTWQDEVPVHLQRHRGRDPAAVRHPAALRADEGRGDHHDRRGPAPDVGRRSSTISPSRARCSPRAGLGSMGFGYPAALGAKVACPDKQVVDIDGDGSFLMNVQELAMAHVEGIAAKVMILNNQCLGMVVQWEDRFYEANRGHTFLGNPKKTYEGSLEDPTGIYPDYVKMCEGFAVQCERVMHKKDLARRDAAHARREGALRARRDGALHRARAADDPERRDLQGRHLRRPRGDRGAHRFVISAAQRRPTFELVISEPVTRFCGFAIGFEIGF